MRAGAILLFGLAGLIAFQVSRASVTPIPDQVQDVLMDNCLKCHDADSSKGDVNLDHPSIDWSNVEERNIWLRAMEAIEQGLMPPPDQKKPNREDRQALLAFLDGNL